VLLVELLALVELIELDTLFELTDLELTELTELTGLSVPLLSCPPLPPHALRVSISSAAAQTGM
jgi:predicted nucleotidyltransferase